MDLSIGVWLLGLFLFMIAISMPIAIAIAMSSLTIMYFILPFEVASITAGQKIITGIDSFSLLAIPFFILAGNIMNVGGIASRLINLLGWLDSGLTFSREHLRQYDVWRCFRISRCSSCCGW